MRGAQRVPNLEAGSFLSCSAFNFDCELDLGGATPMEQASSSPPIPRLLAARANGPLREVKEVIRGPHVP